MFITNMLEYVEHGDHLNHQPDGVRCPHKMIDHGDNLSGWYCEHLGEQRWNRLWVGFA